MPHPAPVMERARRSALFGAVVVCGGRSRRMGVDKAGLALGEGPSFLERAVGLARATCGEVVLACGPAPRHAELGLPLALDAVPDGGPLAGLAAGLAVLRAERAVALPLDMPRLVPGVVEALQERALRDGLDVCFLTGEAGREPLCAVYGRRALPAMERALAAGERRVVSFLEPRHGGAELCVGELPLCEALPGGADAGCLENVNTPSDLARLRGEEAPHR
jgi:molybdopterin-guanine dinucleotide biosynthesis protein A